ncbi:MULTISPECIES: bifunctional DNA primase/polymerase [Rhizobium]|uniref:bifunctional DNA primase/polymerase n=1 Tax=Rhizobium TaxID=379 RepID=UPI000BE9B700|nr:MULTISPECIES: bifunctional DNA primase/polymerase [Rhizobium]MBX5243273.1 bifunctional DNA primase/polymerase [Rhizobium sp. NLR3b]PDS68918.1 DNA primase [Rhizobium phaseoli]
MKLHPQTSSDEGLGELRRQLIYNGYVPVPVNGKRPKIKGWSKFRPKPEQIAGQIRAYPDHQNTGILCGDVVAIDIDVPDEDAAEHLRTMALALPNSDRALQRVGRAPKLTFIFRTAAARRKKITGKYSVNGHDCQVEILGYGQQFVAFGIHPDTGKAYEWVGKSPIDVSFCELPEIDSDTVDAFVDQADAYLASIGDAVSKKAAPRVSQATGGTFWQQVNTAALAEPEQWVKDLFSTARQETGTGAWRVTSEDLGRSLEEDISIHPDGIQDFGTEKSCTAIELVMEYGGAPSAKDAAFWLCGQLGREPSDLGWERRDLGVRMTLGSLSRAHSAANDDDPDDDIDGEPQTILSSSTGLAEELCYPPGAVGEFARFIVGCARFPSPHLALVASLAFTAGLIGRRYRGPTGLRSNIYLVGLAESGFGKDATIRASAALADSTSWGSKVSEWLFMDQIRSLPGLTNKLRKSPSSVCVQDEFGRWLADHTGRNVATHRAEIASALMELTGAPQGFWGGQEKAAGNVARIVAPCFTLHGISTPSTFWGALSSGNISEGLLGRLVLIDVGNSEPVKVRNPPNNIDHIPAALSNRVADLLGLSAGRFTGPFFALNAKSDEKPHPIMTASWAPGVDDVFEEFDDRIRAMKKSIDPQYRPILNRVGENSARLALIVAVGCDPKDPVITTEIQEWANAVAENSLKTILRGADHHIADNEKAAEYLRVRQQVVRRGSSGITMRDIVKNLRGSIDRRRLDDIVAMLRQAREVHLAKLTTDSGQSMVRFWSAESLPKNAIIIPVESG